MRRECATETRWGSEGCQLFNNGECSNMKNVCKLRRTHSKRKYQGKMRAVPSKAKEEAGK